MKGLVGIDVAEAGHLPLVQKESLDGSGSTLQSLHQSWDTRGIQPGIGAESGEIGVCKLILIEHRDEAKGPGIDEADLGAVVEYRHKVGVWGLFEIRCVCAGGNAEAPRHSQMGDHGVAVIQPDDQKLAAPTDRVHVSPQQSGLDLIRRCVMAGSAVMSHTNTLKLPAHHGFLEMSSCDFDFG